jgi:hypothetical protein
MCQSCEPQDPREAVSEAARALRGLYFLLSDRRHVVAGDAELPALVDLIDSKLFPAAEALQAYVPRDFKPRAD